MGDVWMIAAILGSFAILVGFVVACDKIVGPDPASTHTSPSDETRLDEPAVKS